MELLKAGRVPLLAALLLLGGCADDCPEGQEPHGDCAGAVRAHRATLTIALGAPVACDSLRLRIYQGSSVEGGALIEDLKVEGNVRELRRNLPLGAYAAEASYWKGGVLVSAVDGDDLSETTVSHCTCYTYEAKDASLDLVLAEWPR